MERVDEGLGVLFLCTGNSARSLLAEAILARSGAPRFRSYSAGSHPKSAPHPLTLETLERLGHDVRALRSKSWDEFAQEGAPRIDLVITVCASAAGEACPAWPGHPITAHWGVADPAAFSGSPGEARAFFAATHDRLAAQIERLLSLELDALEPVERARRIRAIGEEEAS